MSQPLASHRLDPWLQPAAVAALHGALGSLGVPGVVGGPRGRVALLGAAAALWAGLIDDEVLIVDLAAGEPAMARCDLVVAGSPDVLPLDADEDDAFVAKLVSLGNIVLLATVSPASATTGFGRWPAYWAGRFAGHGWHLVDGVRAAIWEDTHVAPDVKEAALLFVAPGVGLGESAEINPNPSAASALVHPHRLVELQRSFQACLDRYQGEAQAREGAALEATVGELRAQRFKALAFEARLAVAERRMATLADALLARPEPTSWRSALRRLAQPRPAANASSHDRAVVALFDPAYYVEQNPGVAAAPLVHYLERGESEGRRPNPFFDPAFYRDHQADVVASGMGMLAHYARFGGFEGRAASEEFDTAWYVSTYPDVGLSGLHPLLHFLALGRTLGYEPHPGP